VSAKLNSLLITPIQRIPRYLLLLRELQNYTPTEHQGYNDIKGTYVITLMEKFILFLISV